METTHICYKYKMLSSGERVVIIWHTDEAFLMHPHILAQEMHVKRLLFLRKDEEWMFWSEELGSVNLMVKTSEGNLIHPLSLKIAWEIAMNRYLS